jgi:threonine dehydrogenase-like Zn-dependent dehydrogenase
MKALYYDGAGDVEWRDHTTPVIEEPTDALVRPIAVTTCDLDQAILRGGVPGSETPFAIGHEGVGEVVAIGGAVTRLSLGDVVVVPYHVSCGNCDRCIQGVPLYCRATATKGLAVYGMPAGPDHGGMFSELIRVPFASHSLVTVPAGISPVEAVSTGDNLTDAWRVVAPHLRERPGADVLIMSTVPTGLLAADIAQACGAGRVRYVDRDPARLELAETLGVETGTLAAFKPDEHEYDITINASDSKTALRNALLATAPGGHCESMAFHFTEVPLPLLAMHLKCVHFRSSLCNARPHIPAVLELLASNRINPQLIQTDLLPFDSAAETLLSAGNKPVFVSAAL